LSADPGVLAAEAHALEQRMAACRDDIRRLSAEEDPVRGIVHAAAIHQAKQALMVLRYERDLRLARIRRGGG
jgi:hypothetical protein